MNGYYLYKDNNGEDHYVRLREVEADSIEYELREELEQLIPPVHEILYEAVEAVEQNDWCGFIEDFNNYVCRLTDEKFVYEARFDANKLKAQIEDYGDPHEYDFPQAIEKVIQNVAENPIKYPVVKTLDYFEYCGYFMRDLKYLENSNEIDRASFKLVRDGWDYLPTYSEYDENTTYRQDDFKNRQYLGLVNGHGQILGMTRFSIDTISQKTEFRPFEDTYFVNKDGEKLLITPSTQLGKRLVELTQNYLKTNEERIRAKFERDLLAFKVALPINILPNARGVYTYTDDEYGEVRDIFVNANDVEGLDKSTAIRELLKALVIKKVGDKLSDNEFFEDDKDPAKYESKRYQLREIVFVTDGQELWSADSNWQLSKNSLDSLLLTLRNLLKFEHIQKLGPVKNIDSLEGSIRFNRDFDHYVHYVLKCLDNDKKCDIFR